MVHLFRPLTIATTTLINRVVMAPHPSGHATADGFVGAEVYEYYVRRAHGGVGLIVVEPALVIPPSNRAQRHIGVYDDMFIPLLRRMSMAVHGGGARLLMMLEAPAELATANADKLNELATCFVQAAWRAQAAGCDGVTFSAADGGLLHMLVSPLTNHRHDAYGGSATNRMRLPLEIIERTRAWLGPGFLLAFRLVAEEFAPNGTTLQDARVSARRLVSTGVHILDVMTDTRSEAPIARFPGWRVPLASDIKRVTPDVPVISSGLLGDPHLADSVIREGSADLVMLGEALRDNPYWPHLARIVLESEEDVYRS